MNQYRSYQAPGLDLADLNNQLTAWFRSQMFDVQTLPLPDGIIVQACQRQGWRSMVGMSSALNVRLSYVAGTLNVEIGAGKWADKAGAGVVGAFILWPLAITSAVGAYQQSMLDDRVLMFIDQYVSGLQMRAQMAAAPMPAQAPIAAPMQTGAPPPMPGAPPMGAPMHTGAPPPMPAPPPIGHPTQTGAPPQ